MPALGAEGLGAASVPDGTRLSAIRSVSLGWTDVPLDPEPSMSRPQTFDRSWALLGLEAVEFLTHDFHADGGSRKPRVDREQRHECIQLRARRAVLDRPAHVRAEPALDPALRDQRGDHEFKYLEEVATHLADHPDFD